MREETGIEHVALRGTIETIDWYFRFRGRLIHKVCHFFLMETGQATTFPQQAEGITACQWVGYDAAQLAISYTNARLVLHRAQEMIVGVADPRALRPGTTTARIPIGDVGSDIQLGLNLGPGERSTQ